MSITTKPTTKQLLTRAFWLAFQASAPMGMGFFHAAQANEMTEIKLADGYAEEIADGIIDTDYVAGRMMKTTFEVKDGKVVVYPETPRRDYIVTKARPDKAATLGKRLARYVFASGDNERAGKKCQRLQFMVGPWPDETPNGGLCEDALARVIAEFLR